jgi:outer membrane protein assembly factor BamB
MRIRWFGVLTLALLTPTAAPANDWPQWRGPDRLGHTPESDLPLTWDGKTRQNIAWRVPADFGHASPVISAGRVYLAASVRKRHKESDQLADNQTHRVTCYAAEDGAKLWQADVDAGPWNTQFSFTAATPVTDGKALYALFGSGVIVALDLAADGKRLWQKVLPAGLAKAEWLASSPLLHDHTLFVAVDVSDENWLLALDAATGDTRWQLRRKQGERAHNASPLIINAVGKHLLAIAAPDAVLVLDPADGKTVWSCKWGGNRYPSLVFGGGLLIATGEGCETLAIDPAGAGDVSKTHVRWRHPRAPRGFGAPVAAGDYLYRASPPGILRCWKVADGQSVFEEELPGVPTYTSPVATADGLIYFAGPNRTVVIKAGPKLEVVATNDLGEGERNNAEGGQTGPSMAVADGRIFLRGPKSLTCIRKP